MISSGVMRPGVMRSGIMAPGITSAPVRNSFFLNVQPLTKWLTDKAAVIAGTGRAKVVMAGDSSEASYGSSPTPSLLAVNAVDARLARQFASEGLPSTYQSFWGGKGVGSLANWDFRCSQGAWTYEPSGTYGISMGGEFLLAGSNTTISFTPKNDSQAGVNTNTCDLYYGQDPSAGTITKQVDSGTATAVNQNGTSVGMKTQLTTTLGAHTYKANRTGGSANLIGMHCYDGGTRAVDFMNMAAVGSWATSWAQKDFSWNPANMWSLIAPSLVYFSGGANDWLDGTSLSTVKVSVKAAVAAIQASGADVVVAGYNPVDPTYNAVTTVGGQQDLRDMLYEVAVEQDCTFHDVLAEMGGASAYAANQAAGKMFDQLHRNFVGYTPTVNSRHELMAA